MLPQLPAPANRSMEIAEPLVHLTQQIRSGSLLRKGVTKLSSVSHYLRPSTGAVCLQQPIRRGSLVRREYFDPVTPFSYSHSALKFFVMKVMTRNSDFQLSDFNFDFFVDVSNKVSDACGEAFSNLSAVLKSNQSSVSAMISKSSSWSRSVRKLSRVLVNAVFDRESWSRSNESLSVVLLNPLCVVILVNMTASGEVRIHLFQFDTSVANCEPIGREFTLGSTMIHRTEPNLAKVRNEIEYQDSKTMILCFVLDLRCLSPPLLRDLEQSLLQVANFNEICSSASNAGDVIGNNSFGVRHLENQTGCRIAEEKPIRNCTLVVKSLIDDLFEISTDLNTSEQKNDVVNKLRGSLIREEVGLSLDKAGSEVLGHATKVVLAKESTTIVDDDSTQEVSKRVAQIKSLIEVAEQGYEKETESLRQILRQITSVDFGFVAATGNSEVAGDSEIVFEMKKCEASIFFLCE
nr:ruBisCO large subunit-binding protein subunit beta, chloroplastic [Ipomoea batatas]